MVRLVGRSKKQKKNMRFQPALLVYEWSLTKFVLN